MSKRNSAQSYSARGAPQVSPGSSTELSRRKREPSDDEFETPGNVGNHTGNDAPEHEGNIIDDEYRSISFGALVGAQNELNRPRRVHIAEQGKSNAGKVQILRDRLAELKKIREKQSTGTGEPTEEGRHRHSKHAPMEQSSKHAVSRKRPAVELSNNQYNSRDPRFSSASGQLDEKVIQKNYSFLRDYQDLELSELKVAWKKTKDLDTKERLQRQIMAMQNKIKSEQDKERQKDILREHRRREKDAIKQGKKPFYLKKSEQKRLALTEKFEGMRAKERDRAIQRRQKKDSQRERRAIPLDRKIASS